MRYIWFALAAVLVIGAVRVLITGELTMAGGARSQSTSVLTGWVARLFALSAFGFAVLIFSLGTDGSIGQAGGSFADLPRRTRLLFVSGGLWAGLFIAAGLIALVVRGPRPDPYARDRETPAKTETPRPESAPGQPLPGERPPPP